jgi:hypothetical protein
MDIVKYIGRESPWVDTLTGSGLTWVTSMSAQVSDEVGAIARGYPGLFSLVSDGDDLSSARAAQRAANRRTIGATRIIGSQGVTVTSSSSTNTHFYGIEAEAPFSAVRLWLFSREMQQVSRDWEFCVAATEAVGYDTPTNAFVPQVTPPAGYPQAGARRQFNSYVAHADANIYGWRRGTWGGATKSPILPPGTDCAPFAGAGTGLLTVCPGILVSDWIDCRSVPPESGARPHLLMRLRRSAAAGDTHSWLNTFNTDAAGQYYLYGWDRARQAGLPWGRRYYAQDGGAADGVGTLGNMPGSALSFAANNNANMGSHVFMVEFQYDRPVNSVLGLGDSVMESGGYQIYGMDSWLTRAVLSKSTPREPWTVINGGASTCNGPQFMPQLDALVQAGYRPTHVVMPNMSTNNLVAYGNQTMRVVDLAKLDLLHALRVCDAIGAQPVIYNSIYQPGIGAGGSKQIYDALDAFTNELCNKGAARLADFRSGWRPSYLGPDGYHPSSSGIEYMQAVMAAAL